MPAPVPVDLITYRRRRRLARVLTVLVALPAVVLVLQMIARVAAGGDYRSGAALWVLLCWVVAIGGPVLWWAWRRSYRARPVTLPVDAGPGALLGVPELDEEPRHHRGLSGEVEPPRRW